MNLFFKRLLWPALIVALIELLFAQSQPHWFLLTLAFALINMIVLAGFGFILRRAKAPASS